MMSGLKIILILIFIFTLACSKKEKQISVIKEKDLNSQLYEAYSEGMEAFEKGDVLFAAKKFNEAEILYPQSEWAPKSSLMAAYSYYVQDYYADAIAELERFIKVYSSHKNLDYAYYLLAVCYYEQIVDEKKDLQSLLQAKKYFILIKNEYQNSEYALDADFKIDLINDIIASKEIYLGRYYLDKKKWIAAINRFRTVVDEYDTTIYAEEALHRLVEVHYFLGLIDEAEKYAKLLGYNYQSSRWYEQSYSLFDKTYEIRNREIKKDKDNKLLKRFKSIFN
jgi:outer membrane protein assembly factor BamD